MLYIAHFAIRNNNNLFYRFSKIEVGGGPETKHFIGVALATRKKNRTPVLTGPLSSSPVVAWRCHSADANTRRLSTQVTCRNVSNDCKQCEKKLFRVFLRTTFHSSKRTTSLTSLVCEGCGLKSKRTIGSQCCLHNGQKGHTCKTQLLLFGLRKVSSFWLLTQE